MTLGLTGPTARLTGGQQVAEPIAAGLARRGSTSYVDQVGRSSRSAGRRTAAQRGADALASLDFPYRALGYRIVFAAGRSGELGVTNSRLRRITIFVREGQSDLSLRATVAHELGHALDFSYGSEDRHRRYRDIRGLAGGSWYPCSRCDDLASPAGDFAEVFAASLVGGGDFRSRLVGPPSTGQLRALADLLAIPRTAVMAGMAGQEQPSERGSEAEPADDSPAGLPLGLPGR